MKKNKEKCENKRSFQEDDYTWGKIRFKANPTKSKGTHKSFIADSLHNRKTYLRKINIKLVCNSKKINSFKKTNFFSFKFYLASKKENLSLKFMFKQIILRKHQDEAFNKKFIYN